MEELLRSLRDRTATTRLLILATLGARPGCTLSEVAQRLGITVQAVSAHAKEMVADGHLEVADGRHTPTARGRQQLHEGVRGLRDAVAALAQPLEVIQVTSAVAAVPIAAGDQVGLWMVDGDLEARPAREAPSRGRALAAAKPGDEVVVGELRGVVKLEPGRLRIVTVPGPAEGGVARVDAPSLLKAIGKLPATARVGAHGTGARILARRLAGKGLPRLDFEFAADTAAFNAAERGLDVLLLVTRDRLAEVLQGFERLNAATIRRVAVEVTEAPERHG
ncbi:MAG: putative transcriptional regulator [Thermoplasmata archaeon]|jgi:predicted transcriptional regulator|nr:putative transcriptional regulator [Thermoplasmata archaeon]